MIRRSRKTSRRPLGRRSPARRTHKRSTRRTPGGPARRTAGAPARRTHKRSTRRTPGGPARRTAGAPARRFRIAAIEQHIYTLVNTHRRRHGLRRLTKTPAIDRIAQRHARDMAVRRYYSHTSPEGLDPTGRARRARFDSSRYGSSYAGLAENIALAYTYTSYSGRGAAKTYTWISGERALAARIVGGWMKSSGHRANILGPRYVRIGIGVAIGVGHKVYSVQNFC